MAVVSPWCIAVFAPLCFLRTPPLPGQQKNILLLESKTGLRFCLNLGSRLVIMAHIYWDTPALQWKCTILNINMVHTYSASALFWSSAPGESLCALENFMFYKTFHNSDHTLQLGYVKPELVVIVDQPATVKLRRFSRVHTARHVGKIVCTGKSRAFLFTYKKKCFYVRLFICE